MTSIRLFTEKNAVTPINSSANYSAATISAHRRLEAGTIRRRPLLSMPIAADMLLYAFI